MSERTSSKLRVPGRTEGPSGHTWWKLALVGLVAAAVGFGLGYLMVL